MLVAHHDQVPVLVGVNSTVEALVAFGDALVPRAMVSVGMMFVPY